MARLTDHLPGSTSSTTIPQVQGSSRGPSESAPTLTIQAPLAVSSSQLGPAQHGTRNMRSNRHTRDTSVASVGLEPSDLANIDLSQLHVESDSSDSDYRTTHRPVDGSGHTRSMSNPFPSLFSPKKKTRGKNGPSLEPGDAAFSGDGEVPPPRFKDGHRGGFGILAPSGAPANRRPSFSTGPCITCGSLMRWARGAIAFRCGICLTVNDLVPTDNLLARARESVSEAHDVVACGPISIDQTQRIVAQCIESYLEAVLQDVDVNSADCSQVQLSLGSRGPERNVTAPSRTASLVPLSNSIGYHDTGATKSQRRLCTGQTNAKEKTSTVSSNNISHDRQSIPEISATLPTPTNRPEGEMQASWSAKKQNASEKNGEEREAKRIFLPLEDYVVGHIVSVDSLDSSFTITPFPGQGLTAQSELLHTSKRPWPSREDAASLHSQSVLGPDALRSKGQARRQPPGVSRVFHRRLESEGKGKIANGTSHKAASRPIVIDWVSVNEWYSVIINAGATWEAIYNKLVDRGKCAPQPHFVLQEIESHILKGQQHAQRVLLKCIETVLKRPGRRIGEFGDFRFLIIALANPLLHASCKFFTGNLQHGEHGPAHRSTTSSNTTGGTGPASGQHSVIIKRILGLMSNCSDEWHGHIITCFAQFSEAQFLQIKDLVGGFLAYRLVRYNKKKDVSKHTETSDLLVPKISEGASAASFHAALNQASGTARKPKQTTEKKILHGDDWQIKAAVRVLKLLFTANISAQAMKNTSRVPHSDADLNRNGRARLRGQIVPTSDFYITLLDNCDLVSDFEGWEQQTAKFSFCQYPFLLSVWAKIQILEYEARRQMKNKARDAFFDSIMTRRNFDQHLILNVRRDCLVEDSLKGVSAAIGSGTDDIKKGLRIIFNGEEGIDAGGLRKEWFLLLVREVFNPDHGMFTYDEESQYCYFNPASFETSDQFFLVGVVMGLAIYNSTILDVALPPFSFRKLLLAAPTLTTGVLATSSRPSMKYTLADLAEYRPRLARGLQQLLDYDGDVEATFCLDFSITVEKFGYATIVPLCPGGESRPVNNLNRCEYVDMYVRYLLDTSVSRQFEPFKRGFFTVCGCNALGLFRPEEIELLVRGSDEPLDVASLRLAASYENWPSAEPPEKEPTIIWFWEIFHEASPKDQRKLLIFITGSDRIPATGPASLSIRILYLGNDTGRFPTARTCFNILTLYRYASKETMSTRLWGAVNGSEGFGLK